MWVMAPVALLLHSAQALGFRSWLPQEAQVSMWANLMGCHFKVFAQEVALSTPKCVPDCGF